MHKRIFYTVLNWGLGHAARSIPIITQLTNAGYLLTIGSDGAAAKLLQIEFPELKVLELPSYNVVYGSNRANFNTTILKQIPHFVGTIKKENKRVAQLVETGKFDFIISDNRYGCYNQNVPSFFIGHQLHIRYPESNILEKIINKVHANMLAKFNKIWLPDTLSGHSLSGELSSKYKGKVKPIGILSRMKKIDAVVHYDLCVVLSGPEPQRSILENILIEQLSDVALKIVFVRGSSEKTAITRSFKNPESIIYGFCTTEQLNNLMASSHLVVCRSGYSSVMDLIKMQQQALLIPTPGQTEQEYLASYYMERKWFYSENQETLNLAHAIKIAQTYLPPKLDTVTLAFTDLLN